jgi:hypothetical protein
MGRAVAPASRGLANRDTSDVLFCGRVVPQPAGLAKSERIEEIEEFLYSSKDGAAENPLASVTGGKAPKAGSGAKRKGNSAGARG